jgi:EmrB/QacA subfamily drug resistance transporter
MTQTTAAPAGTPPAPADSDNPWRALAVVLTGAFMASVDGFIVLVGAPAIQANLHATGAEIQLLVAGYQLTYAIGLITGARLGDLYGRKRMFLTGMAIFTLASVACGLAPGVGVLLGARLAQGLGAALMFPQIFAIIQVLLPPQRRHTAFGALGAVLGVATTIGQIVGGLLISADILGTSWRLLFLVNIPIGIIAMSLGARLVPESKAPKGSKLDLSGVGVLTVALFLLVVPLIEGQQAGWPAWVWPSFAGSALAFGAFAVLERRVEARGGAPLVSPRLFGERAFTMGMVLVVVAFSVVYSVSLVLSLTLQDGLGLSALGAAFVYTPLAVSFFVASLLASKLTRRFGPHVLRLGAIISASGFLAMIVAAALSGEHLSYWRLLPALILIGAGNGLLLPQLFNAVLSRIKPGEVGMASGVLSTGQQVGGALGVAIVGVVFYHVLGAATPGSVGAYASALTFGVLCNLVAAVIAIVLVFALPRQRM